MTVDNIGCLREVDGTLVALLFAAEVTGDTIALDEMLKIDLTGVGVVVENEAFELDVMSVDPSSTTKDG